MRSLNNENTERKAKDVFTATQHFINDHIRIIEEINLRQHAVKIVCGYIDIFFSVSYAFLMT